MSIENAGEIEWVNNFATVDGKKVRALRKASKLTMRHISNEALIGYRTLVQIESDRKPNRRKKETIEALAAALGCNPIDIIDKSSSSLYFDELGVGESGPSSPAKPKGVRLLQISMDEVSRFCQDITDKLKNKSEDHIFNYMLSSLLKRLPSSVSFRWSPDKFSIQTPSDDYPLLLEGASAANFGRGIEAIAELSDPVEGHLWKNPDPDKTMIAQRIFLTHPRVLLEPETFDPILQMLHQQRELYPVRIGVTSPGEPWEHPLGADGVGKNMIMFEPDLVGGYVNDNKKIMLKIVSDENVYAKARRAYDEQLRRSIEIQPGWTAELVRRYFIEFENLGWWDPAWREVGERPEVYFNKYDKNIRCWIPEYDRMIARCSEIIQRRILHMIRSPEKPLKLLEVGYGTGGLTQPLLHWIDRLNSPASKHKFQFVDEYFGVDSAPQMLKRVHATIGDSGSAIRKFSVGDFNRQTLASVAGSRKFDIIFGSLVLHDLLEADPKEAIVDEFFHMTNDYIMPGGCLVFADVFVELPQQVEQWWEYMRWAGLPQEKITAFEEGNPEMIKTVKLAMLQKVSKKYGFQTQMMTIPGRSAELRPFRIMLASKS